MQQNIQHESQACMWLDKLNLSQPLQQGGQHAPLLCVERQLTHALMHVLRHSTYNAKRTGQDMAWQWQERDVWITSARANT